MRDLSSRQRSMELHHHIDAGFINIRKCYSVYGTDFIQFVETHRKPDDHFQNRLHNNHLIVNTALQICKVSEDVRTLSEI